MKSRLQLMDFSYQVKTVQYITTTNNWNYVTSTPVITKFKKWSVQFAWKLVKIL